MTTLFSFKRERPARNLFIPDTSLLLTKSHPQTILILFASDVSFAKDDSFVITFRFSIFPNVLPIFPSFKRFAPLLRADSPPPKNERSLLPVVGLNCLIKRYDTEWLFAQSFFPLWLNLT
jgi:hypothetical protein